MLCRRTGSAIAPLNQTPSIVNKVIRLYAKLEKIAELEDTKSNESEFNDIVRYFENFLSSKKNQKSLFRWFLKDDVVNGTINERHRDNNLLQGGKCDAESDINGDSLLLRVMSIPSEDGGKKRESLDAIKRMLIENCKEMIVFSKKNEKCKGMTPIHVAILKGDTILLQEMADILGESKKDMVQGICAVGPVFQKTAMMAGTLLGVATLKFNREVFDVVLTNFSSGLHETNEKGDNIVHSLIKYAHVQPDEKKDALTMLRYILNSNTQNKICKLLRMKNKEKLTPLQVSAKRQQYDFFEEIMHHELYHSKQTDYGLYSEAVYDITEIESLAITNNANTTDHDDDHIKDEYHESVLEYIVHHQTDNAFRFANFLPVREVIKEKWRYYKWLVWVWLAIHFTFIILLSVAAFYRSKLSESRSNPNKMEFQYLVLENSFVTVASVFGVVFGLLHFGLEITSLRINRFQYKTSLNWLKRVKSHFKTPYSNFMFRIYFMLFYLLLLVDILIVVVVQDSFLEYNNICLIFAVIMGWYLFLFFLQGFKALSFFTVLIQRVILDMLKFAFVMLIFLVGFSIAMFMIMQGADTEEDDFNHFGKTMLKMLTIMLGIGELGILFQARQPILAISVFVIFVCLTTILLLNALIALMSNSCTELMSNGMIATKLHCRLQRLSLILFLENYLPLSLCKEIGFIKGESRFEGKELVNTVRRFWSLDSVQELLEDEIDVNLGNQGRRRKPKKRKIKLNLFNTIQGDMHRTNEKTLDITDMNHHTDDMPNVQTQRVT